MHEARYASSSVDEFSRLAVAKHLVKKSDPPEKFPGFVAEHGVPKCMRLDNGGEYSPNFLQRFSGETRVHRAYTQQYVVAERKTVKKELLACVRLPSVLSRSRQQTETGSKEQERQVHQLRRGEQSLTVDESGDKTSGASRKRDFQ